MNIEFRNNSHLGKKETRIQMATNGINLDQLINDSDAYVRATVAEQGYGLDQLVNDPDSEVREAVAKQGYGLAQLIYDEDEDVRNTATRLLLQRYIDTYGILDEPTRYDDNDGYER